MTLYLASTSPRRRSLLEAAGVAHTVVVPGPEPVGCGAPTDVAVARAASKAAGAIVAAEAAGLVLGVDTVVDVDGEELGKPRDAAEAAAMWQRLAGREHLVHTAVCVRHHPDDGRRWSGLATARVRFDALDREAIERHIELGLWCGKAGGYGIQDSTTARVAALVDGALDTVIGLPVALVCELAERARADAR